MIKFAVSLIVVSAVLTASALAQTPTATPNYDELKARLERAEGRLKDWPGLTRYAE
jgi:hypothetical protein